MSGRIHVLARELFGKDTVEACTLQEIEELAQRYPYFAPAQFLLLQKLKEENAPGYVQQLQKAVLYYHNPLEFEYFINRGKFETELPLEETVEESEEAPHVQTASDEASSELPGQDDSVQPGDEYVSAAPAINETPAADEPQQVHQWPAEQPSAEPEPQSAGENERLTTNVTTSLSQEYNDELPGDTIDDTGEVQTAVVDEEMQEKIEKVLQQEEQQIGQPPKNNTLVFEPYHTVDYFASQGIKLSQAEASSDKFGRQLKSFTEWLKTMKRLPAGEVGKNMDNTSESRVEHLAQHSVHDSSVVTEAMAEVWIKQGNIEKAIETYNKLGLQNPSKKAYFAGLIENLKRS